MLRDAVLADAAHGGNNGFRERAEISRLSCPVDIRYFVPKVHAAAASIPEQIGPVTVAAREEATVAPLG